MNTYYYLDNKDFPIVVSDKTIQLTESTFLKNNTLWESESIKYFYSKIDKSRPINIVDIGAQSGLYSLLAKYLPKATFYSFEPFTPTYNLLCENIELNNISNIKHFNIAISNNKGKSILNTCESHNGLHTLGENPLRFNDIKPIEVDVDTIDNLFFYNNIPVDYMKIDTEGYEYYILKGAEKTIKQYRPFIQLEYNETNQNQCNSNINTLLNYIEELGYIKLDLRGEELCIVHESKKDDYNF